MKREPVMITNAALALVQAGLVVTNSMGWTELTADQLESWMAFWAAVAVVANLWVRTRVSPT